MLEGPLLDADMIKAAAKNGGGRGKEDKDGREEWKNYRVSFRTLTSGGCPCPGGAEVP